MKKIILATLFATAIALPALAETTVSELKDGTKIEITDGSTVTVVGKDGTQTPAPDGVHELKDGSKIQTEHGKIVK